MNRRRILAYVASLLMACTGLAQPYFVATTGDDTNPGTLERPFASLQHAREAVRRKRGEVILRGGVYYLSAPLVFTAEDSGTKEEPVVYRNFPGEAPVISGGLRLDHLQWKPGAGGVLTADIPEGLTTEELFVNGERQVLARYPDFDATAQYFNGFSADAISPERVARWSDPTGGYFHAMHPALWGDFTWRINGKDPNGRLQLEGGWQNNRLAAPHEQLRFVENILEELDAPGEWFLDRRSRRLHFKPPAGLALEKAVVVATRLRTLVEFRGSSSRPVKWITLRGITFRHAARTMMENREPLLRSDWTIHRNGAILFNGAEDCRLEDAFLDQVGGNAVFVNHYNRRISICGTHIAGAGASGICFVGDPQAARSPLFNYHQVQELEAIDRSPGPKSQNYPAECLVEDCLIHETGRVEKQSAGVMIELAQDICLRHCSIYEVPRAGINIGSGCWGGHTIEFCDVFDTVKETGDHGSFNSWGRDRFWRPDIDEVNTWVRQAPELPLLDAVKPIRLLNSRWRCDHGWDIDLDDGSSHYEIRNNLCLHGGIKLREGYARVVENNILVDCGFDPHVWYSNSGDVFRRNILCTDYRPARMPPPPWGKEMDSNLLHDLASATPTPAFQLQTQSGRDSHSLRGDARFLAPELGDYRVKDGSPALALGFVNTPMDRFGVQKPELRALARTPPLPGGLQRTHKVVSRSPEPVTWFGMQLKNIENEGEMSAFGLPGVTGVLVTQIPAEHPVTEVLRTGDVILAINGQATTDTAALLHQTGQPDDLTLRLQIIRNQQSRLLTTNRLGHPPRQTKTP